jgi:hypothetical protein
VCRKRDSCGAFPVASVQESLSRARAKILRLADEGFSLSRNDRKIVFFGQLLTAISAPADLPSAAERVPLELDRPAGPHRRRRKNVRQGVLFEET